jgi:hypothetical protein
MDDQEYELKQVELTLREREVAAREREVAAKEKESNLSQWFNPLVIGLVGAALALGGNILTNILNNHASDHAERVRAQSNLVLSVIKTNGNETDTCKNLNFFVSIGWLDDERGAIHKVCGTKGQGGVPTLPAASVQSLFDQPPPGLVSNVSAIATTLTVRIRDADSHEPVAGATVLHNLGSDSQPSTTDATGSTILNFVSTTDSVTVSKPGYQTVRESMAPYGMEFWQKTPTVTIVLHRAPTPKP